MGWGSSNDNLALPGGKIPSNQVAPTQPSNVNTGHNTGVENNVWKRKSAQRIENEKIIRAKKTLKLLKSGRIPVEFRDENKKKDFRFLPNINVIIEFLDGLGIDATEFSHPGLRTAWGEAMISTKNITDLFERIKEHDKRG